MASKHQHTHIISRTARPATNWSTINYIRQAIDPFRGSLASKPVLTFVGPTKTLFGSKCQKPRFHLWSREFL